MIKRIFAAVGLCSALLAAPASAAPISFGSLSSNDDGSTEIITDSLNDRDWLRWDVLKDLTYAQTLTAIGAGGAYEGWSIAGIQEAQDFTDALLSGGSNACTTTQTGYTQCAGGLSVDFDALLGSSYSSHHSYAWFLSDNQTQQAVGYVHANSYPYASSGGTSAHKDNQWSFITSSDNYSSSGFYSSTPIGWLLYRDTATTPVPVPAALPLMLVGIGAFAGLARRKRARVHTSV